MKDFFDEYVAVPLAILLFTLMSPTAMIAGVSIGLHFAGYLPDMDICKKVENE